jgi:hypothetical protein
MPGHNRLSVRVRVLRVFQGLAGVFVPGQMSRFVVVLGDPVGVRGDIVQLGGPLVVFVVRSVIIASRHNYKLTICPDFVWASWASL